MKKALMGAALLAVATCGSARAAALSFQGFDLSAMPFYSVSFAVNFGNPATADYEYANHFISPDYYSINFDQTVTYSSMFRKDGAYEIDATLTGPVFASGLYSQYNGKVQSLKFSFVTFGAIDKPALDQSASGTATFTDQFGADASVNGTFTGNFISTVPIPASAPLFAAALLALGSIGYARRRASMSA